MKAVYALYSTPDSAQAAWTDLRAAGIDADAITVVSSEPFEDYEFGDRHAATWMYWIAGCGGALGLAIGYGLTSITQRSWPLVTGGMPIVAMWPNLIVMFELTMLGGMLATVATLFVSAGLATKAAPIYDEEIAQGKILVGVRSPSETTLNAVEGALRANGPAAVRTIS